MSMQLDQEFSSKQEFRQAVQDGDVVRVMTRDGKAIEANGVLRVHAARPFSWTARVQVERGEVVSVLQ